MSKMKEIVKMSAQGMLLLVLMAVAAVIFWFLSESLFIWTMNGNQGNPIMLYLEVKECENLGGEWNYTISECSVLANNHS